MITHKFKIANDVKKVTINGREYLVAPATMIVEGVLNNELVLAEEFGRYPGAWNGIPVVIDHPLEGEGSANTTSVQFSMQTIGRVFEARSDGNRLRASLWIDVSHASTSENGRQIVSDIESGVVREVSTAYYRDVEVSSGVFGSQRYETVARNIRPDHLAILVNDPGACSVNDGCGTPRLNGDVSPNIDKEKNNKMPQEKNLDELLPNETVATESPSSVVNVYTVANSHDTADDETVEEVTEAAAEADGAAADFWDSLREEFGEAELREGLRAIVQQNKSKRTELIKNLANTGQFVADILEGMPTDALESVWSALSTPPAGQQKPANYFAMNGAGLSESDGSNEDNSPPAITFQK